MKNYDDDLDGVYALAPKGIEIFKMSAILYINDWVKGKCPFCKIETYNDDENTYIPFDVDFHKRIIYCKQCGKTIITMDEMSEYMFTKIKEENE